MLNSGNRPRAGPTTLADKRLKVSVIIPTLNEAGILGKTLDLLLPLQPDEILIADGGSSDRTREIAETYPVRWVACPRGRARQMNAGAEQARGDLLVFLHADTSLDPDGYKKMKQSMADETRVGGAFSLNIASPAKSLRLISRLANLRARTLKLVYGDQAFFVRAETFSRLGGFQALPICEDLDFFLRLKSQGGVLILPHKAHTSARRWEIDGVFYCTLRNSVIAGAFLLGFPPRLLSKWYTVRR